MDAAPGSDRMEPRETHLRELGDPGQFNLTGVRVLAETVGTCTQTLVSLTPWEVTVKPFLGRGGDSFSCICILMFLDKLTDNMSLVWLVCCAFWLWLFFPGPEAAPLGQRPCINEWNSGVALTAALYFCGYSVAPSVAFQCLNFQSVMLIIVWLPIILF